MSHIFIGEPRDVGKPPHYFAERHCTIDYRGELTIHPSAQFGFEIGIYTRTHPSDWLLQEEWSCKSIGRKVVVEERAWICSRALLYSCTIGKGAVVGIGAVVMGVDVEPYTMVGGNPARVIGRYIDGKWVKERE